jgi:hypothetical protein
VSVVLDAGALLALERGEPNVTALLKRELAEGRAPRTHGGVIGQVWRGGGPRQARLARGLLGIHVRSIDDDLGRRAGALLGRARKSDVIAAAVVLIADDEDEVLTDDPTDLAELASAAGRILHLARI